MKAGDLVFVSLNDHLAHLKYDTDPAIPIVRVYYSGKEPHWDDEDWHKAHIHRVVWSFAGPVKMQCLTDLD